MDYLTRIWDSKKRWLIGAGILLSVIVFELIILFSVVIPRANKATIGTELVRLDEGTVLVNGAHVEQVVYSQSPLCGIAVRLGTWGEALDGVLHTEVYDVQTGDLLISKKSELKDAEDGERFNIIWNSSVQATDNLYRVRLSVSGMQKQKYYMLWFTDMDVSGMGQTAICYDEDVGNYLLIESYGTSCFLLPMYITICVVLDFLLGVGWLFTTWSSPKKVQTLFPMCAFVLGVLLMIVYPSYSVHDEERHIPWVMSRASAWSSGQWDVEGGIGVIREEEIQKGYTVFKPKSEQYKYFLDTLVQSEKTNETIEIEVNPSGVPYEYAPQIAGVLLSRVWHLGQTATLYLSQIFALTFYIAVCWMAICISPYPTMFAIVALFPSVLRSAGSFSYDCFINAVGMLLVAVWLHLIESKENIAWKQIVAIVLISLVLAPCKGIYIPICLLIFLLPRERWKVRRAREGVFILIALLSVGLLWGATGNVLSEKATSTGMVVGPWNNEAYSVSMLLSQPFELLRLTIVSMFEQSLSLVFSAVGGIQHINIPNTVEFLLICLAVRAIGADREFPKVKSKWIFAAVVFLVTGLGYAATITWTTVGSYGFMGMQGRYLIPVLTLIFLLVPQQTRTKVRSEILLYCTILLSSYSVLFEFIKVIW